MINSTQAQNIPPMGISTAGQEPPYIGKTGGNAWVQYYTFFALVDSLKSQQKAVEALALQLTETEKTIQYLTDLYTALKYLQLTSKPTKSEIIYVQIENQMITSQKDFLRQTISTANQGGQIENSATVSGVQAVSQTGSTAAGFLKNLGNTMKSIVNIGKQ